MSAAARAWPLPRWSASEAQARNVLARHSQPMCVSPWNGPGPHPWVRLRPLGPGAPILGPDEVTRLAFDWSGGRLWLDFPTSTIERWAHLSLELSTWVDLDAPLREAALEAALGGVVASLSATGRGHARFSGAQDCGPLAPAASRHSCALEVTFENSTDALIGVLHTDTLGLLLLGGLAEQAQAPLDADLAASQNAGLETPVTWQLSLGFTDLPYSQLQTLQRGDVVFISHHYANGDMRLQMRCETAGHGTVVALAQLDDLNLTLVEAPRAMDNTPSSDSADPTTTPDDAATEHPIAMQDIPVRLSFDVGHKTVTMAQLQQLQPGSSLVLDRPATEYVTLRANGAVIGSGHLVEIDNRLGVSIDSLQPGPTRHETHS